MVDAGLALKRVDSPPVSPPSGPIQKKGKKGVTFVALGALNAKDKKLLKNRAQKGQKAKLQALDVSLARRREHPRAKGEQPVRRLGLVRSMLLEDLPEVAELLEGGAKAPVTHLMKELHLKGAEACALVVEVGLQLFGRPPLGERARPLPAHEAAVERHLICHVCRRREQ